MNLKYLNFFPKFRYSRSVLVGGILAVALISCSILNRGPGNPSGVEGSTTPSQTVEMQVEPVDTKKPLKIILNVVNKESALMNQAGGTLTLTSAGSYVSMTLPSSALFEENEISLTAVSAIENLPISSGLLSAVQMGPEGLKFMQPVTISLELPDPVPDGLMGFMLKDDGHGFHFYPGEIIGNTFTFQVMHFSTVGVGIVTDADREAASSSELAGMELAEELIANLNILTEGIPFEEIYEPYFEEIATILYEAYMGEGGIWDQFVSAKSVEEMKSAFLNFYEWRSYLEWANIGDWTLPMPIDCGNNITCKTFDDLDSTGRDLINMILKENVNDENKKCLEGDSSREAVVFDILNFADMLAEWHIISIENYDQLMDQKTCGLWSLKLVVPNSVCSYVGDTFKMEVIARNKKGDILPNREVFWQSDNPNVATVDNSGSITATGFGSTSIHVFDKAAGNIHSFTDSVSVKFISLTGNWTVTETANETACGDKINTYTSSASITHKGSLVSITGGRNGILSGFISGCSIMGIAHESEDGGISFGSGGLTISPDGNLITGSGSWTWIGDGESCSGTSSITFQR